MDVLRGDQMGDPTDGHACGCFEETQMVYQEQH
jgi:hypothetical protein